jgi:hypothetical protein
MFSYLMHIIRTNHLETTKQSEPNASNKTNTIFNKDYRHGYNKLWINNIRNYHP